MSKTQKPTDRESYIFTARVLLREARARRGTRFAATLLEWAANNRRRAAEAKKPVQSDLLGGNS